MSHKTELKEARKAYTKAQLAHIEARAVEDLAAHKHTEATKARTVANEAASKAWTAYLRLMVDGGEQ